MSRKYFHLSATAFSLVILCCFQVRATSFTYLPTFDEMVGSSSLAFHGKVTGISYSYVTSPKSGRKIPYTIVTYRVITSIINAAEGETITIMQGGGMHPDGKRYLSISDVPFFTVGDEVILFANDSINPYFGAYYAEYGLYRVVRDVNGDEYVLSSAWSPLIWDTEGKTFRRTDEPVCVPDSSQRDYCTDWNVSESSSQRDIAVDHDIDGHAINGTAKTSSNEDSKWYVSLGSFIDKTDDIIRSDSYGLCSKESRQVITNNVQLFEEGYLKMMSPQ